jgi:hypothetical protein
MGQRREAMTQNLAERLCWQAAYRDDARVARRLYRKHVVDGVYRLDEGALLDDVFQFWRELGVLDRRAGVQGKALQRTMVPIVPYLVRSGLQTLCGIDRMKALPALLCSAAAIRQWVGVNAQQVRHGVCPRGAAKRQHPRPEGPRCPDTLAHNSVKRHLRDREAWFNGTMRALATAGLFGAKATGIIDAPALDTTAAYEGRGQATRKRKITDKQGRVHEIEIAVYSWKPIVSTGIIGHLSHPAAQRTSPHVRARGSAIKMPSTDATRASSLEGDSPRRPRRRR